MLLKASEHVHVVGAANGRGLLNPMVVVQGQIYQIVNGGPTVNDLLHGWTVVGHNNSVMYSGPRGLQEAPFLPHEVVKSRVCEHCSTLFKLGSTP